MPLPLMAIALGSGILGKLLGGGARGAAQERGNQNNFQGQQNQQALQRYGTNQSALLQALLAQDRGAMDRYGTQQAATTNAMNTRQGATSRALEAQSAEGMQRARLGLEAPNVRARQSILGSLMQNMQPVSIEASPNVARHVPKITGGMSAAALDPMTRQHGGELMKAALQAQLSGSDVPQATNFMGGVLDSNSAILQPPGATDFRSGVLQPPEMSGYRNAGRGESLMSGGSMVANILSQLLPMINGGGGLRKDSSLYEEDFG